MDDQSLPRLMEEIMVGCQYGNKLICYSKLRQGAKWIMINDPPPDDGPSLLSVELGTPINDEHTHQEFVDQYVQDHGLVGHHSPSPGKGWNPEMTAGLGAPGHHGGRSNNGQERWEPEERSGHSLGSLQAIYNLHRLDNL